jgi:hypothetical protein
MTFIRIVAYVAGPILLLYLFVTWIQRHNAHDRRVLQRSDPVEPFTTNQRGERI